MQKKLVIMLVMIAALMLPQRVCAAEPSFRFELLIDGREEKETETGDIITVSLYLKRTDSNEAYKMYAMQDELRYDGEFLELVAGSEMLGKGVESTDIGLGDGQREYYMNYLSMNGGTEWSAETLVGSVQFRVKGESGVSKITSGDYLVSNRDGSGSYECRENNEVLVIVSTECRVSFKANGGSETEEQIVQYGEKVRRPEDPRREGYRFGGWYKDIHLREEWDFEEDVVEGNMSLYAKWIEEERVEAGGTPETGAEAGKAAGETTVGDSGAIWYWVTAAGVCAVLLIILLYIRRKKKDGDA